MWDPVHRQQAATMIKAIEDLSSPSARIREDAARWILSESFHVNTFRGICYDLGYDADKSREQLKKLGLDPIAIFLGYRPKKKVRLKKLLRSLGIKDFEIQS